jgi:hypothetical protein
MVKRVVQARWGLLVALVTVLAAGCGGATLREPSTAPGAASIAPAASTLPAAPTAAASPGSSAASSAAAVAETPSSSASSGASVPLATATSRPSVTSPPPQAAAPVLFSMRPTTGAAGTAVTFLGAGLGSAAGRVQFTPAAGGPARVAPMRAWSATRVVCLVPAGLPAGYASPALWTAAGTPVGPGGTGAWPQFLVAAPLPAVSGFAPSAGPAGTLLTIRGHGFGSTPGLVTLCQFCGTGAQISAHASIVAWSSTQVEARIPAAFQAGSAQAHLVTAGGAVVTVGTFDVWAGPAVNATPAG